MKIVMARVGPNDQVVQQVDLWSNVRPVKGDGFIFQHDGELIETVVARITLHPFQGGVPNVAPNTQLIAYCR